MWLRRAIVAPCKHYMDDLSSQEERELIEATDAACAFDKSLRESICEAGGRRGVASESEL